MEKNNKFGFMEIAKYYSKGNKDQTKTIIYISDHDPIGLTIDIYQKDHPNNPVSHLVTIYPGDYKEFIQAIDTAYRKILELMLTDHAAN